MAQSRAGITVSPFIIEEVVSPGQSFTKEIILTNNSDEERIFYIYLQDFRAKEESGEILLLPAGSEKFSLIGWLEFPEERIEFAPKESRQVSVNFHIPERAAAGSRYGAIIFGSEPLKFILQEDQDGVFASFGHEVGVLVFFYSSRGAIEEAKIQEFRSDKAYYYTPFKVNFIGRIENLGNVYIEPVGIIKIENMFGKEVAVLPFNQEGLKVLPETIRRFEESWQGNFGFGRYSASLFVNFGTSIHQGGTGTRTIFAKAFFWILPWKTIVLGLIFIVLFVCFFLKKYKKINLKNT